MPWPKGRKHSSAENEANRIAQMGHHVSAETRAKMSASNRGQKRTAETCSKISVARRGQQNRLTHGRSYTREYIAEKTTMRQARKHGAFIERVYRAVVLARDNSICGICRTAVDPNNWHLDHIIPLSRGGKHSYANTQVTHPQCNMRKGNRLSMVLAA